MGDTLCIFSVIGNTFFVIVDTNFEIGDTIFATSLLFRCESVLWDPLPLSLSKKDES